MNSIIIFGLGFTARALAKRLCLEAWNISATSRTDDGVAAIEDLGYRGFKLNSDEPVGSGLKQELERATHALVSAPPGPDGDPILKALSVDFKNAKQLNWIGYLSTIGVYGDHDGAWIDERTGPTPSSVRSKRRLAAEHAWQRVADEGNHRLQIFRLAGIYGPGRSALNRVKSGSARAIIKPGQVFNRVHVEDAATVVQAALEGRGTETIYNLTDDLPAPPEDVIDYAAELLGAPLPPRLSLEAASLSDMAQSFYSENKRVRNQRIKDDLGVQLRYPTFREGLAAIMSLS